MKNKIIIPVTVLACVCVIGGLVYTATMKQQKSAETTDLPVETQQDAETFEYICYDTAGTYSDEVTYTAADITADGVVLENATFDTLTITEDVGDGTVTLNNDTVQKTLVINGGGQNSVYLNGGTYAQVISNDEDVHIVIGEETNVTDLNVLDSSYVEVYGSVETANVLPTTFVGEITWQTGFETKEGAIVTALNISEDVNTETFVADTSKGEVAETTTLSKEETAKVQNNTTSATAAAQKNTTTAQTTQNTISVNSNSNAANTSSSANSNTNNSSTNSSNTGSTQKPSGSNNNSGGNTTTTQKPSDSSNTSSAAGNNNNSNNSSSSSNNTGSTQKPSGSNNSSTGSAQKPTTSNTGSNSSNNTGNSSNTGNNNQSSNNNNSNNSTSETHVHDYKLTNTKTETFTDSEGYDIKRPVYNTERMYICNSCGFVTYDSASEDAHAEYYIYNYLDFSHTFTPYAPGLYQTGTKTVHISAVTHKEDTYTYTCSCGDSYTDTSGWYDQQGGCEVP